MNTFDPSILKKLHLPKPDSHKGQNGKVMVIAGSELFHAASLWALEAASRIVDMVYFASTQDNNDLVKTAKKRFSNGIVIPRYKIHDYIRESDSILIGPGLPREDGQEESDDNTRDMTKKLLAKYPNKKWIIDGGSLQVMDPEWIPKGAILTPHTKEFETLFSCKISDHKLREKKCQEMAKQYNCVIVQKGTDDIVCSPDALVYITGGNAGMTKGGTGDVLAGIAAGLYAQNDDPFLTAQAASYFNKKAGEQLFSLQGYWYNASDLLTVFPSVMKQTLLD